MNQVKTTNAQDMSCSANRRNSGLSAPRTCEKCRLGPCHYRAIEAASSTLEDRLARWREVENVRCIPRIEDERIKEIADKMRPLNNSEWTREVALARAIEDEMLLRFSLAMPKDMADTLPRMVRAEAALRDLAKILGWSGDEGTPFKYIQYMLFEQGMESYRGPRQKARTDQEIVDQTDDLAREFAKFDGYELDGKFYNHDATRAKHYWALACTAQAHLTNTDSCDALSALEDQQASAAPGSVQDHVVREVVNKLCDIAKEHHDGEQLRVRLCAAIEPLIK